MGRILRSELTEGAAQMDFRARFESSDSGEATAGFLEGWSLV